jgi:anti-sigma regulatory factor (Ser/Thr protein kinase)
LESYYQPARAVGGDFYDFLYFEDGRLGILIGDVTDKGVPAALVMATTRSILRSNAFGALSPGKVLEQTNDLLHPDIPPKMFVTCLYAILDPASGQLQYANAGHDLPYWHHKGGISELRATGMPLGLMPGMVYEEKEAILAPGDSVLLYSDGLVEAHNAKRDMFGFPRLMTLLGEYKGNMPVIDLLLGELAEFTGSEWEQEDDVTLVTLRRSESNEGSEIITMSTPHIDEKPGDSGWHMLAEMKIASEPGNERQAMEQVGQAVQVLNLPERRLEKLKTAVAEATMNAMEHGNKYQPDVPVTIQVLISEAALMVRIRDQGNGKPIVEPHTPDIEAKLAELQSPRGWGLFLIKNLVDDVHVISDEDHHTLELILYLEGDNHDGK